MNKFLIQIAIDALAFFELADDSTVNPDVAVEQIETITANLRQMTPDEQKVFLSYLSEQAERLRGDPIEGPYVSFLDGLQESLTLL